MRKKKENKDSITGGNLIPNKALQVGYEKLKRKQNPKLTFHGSSLSQF